MLFSMMMIRVINHSTSHSNYDGIITFSFLNMFFDSINPSESKLSSLNQVNMKGATRRFSLPVTIVYITCTLLVIPKQCRMQPDALSISIYRMQRSYSANRCEMYNYYFSNTDAYVMYSTRQMVKIGIGEIDRGIDSILLFMLGRNNQ